MKKLISRRNFSRSGALAGSAAALSACGGRANPTAATILLPQLWT